MTANKYIAVFGLSAFSGIGIVEIEYGIDDVCVNDYFTEESVVRRRNKIKYNKDGEAYIQKYGQKYYLSEFLKTDGGGFS